MFKLGLTFCQVPGKMAYPIQGMERKGSCDDCLARNFRPLWKLMYEIDNMSRVYRDADDGSGKIRQEESVHSCTKCNLSIKMFQINQL